MKSSKCDKKSYLLIEEMKAKIPSSPGDDKPEIEAHYLRSMNKNRVSEMCFSFKEFATQLLEFGEDLLYSSLVSTKLDCFDWAGRYTLCDYICCFFNIIMT